MSIALVAATGTHSVAERSYSTRGYGQKRRGPPLRGAAAKRNYPMSTVRGRSQEELPHIQGQKWWPRVSGCDSAGAAERSYPTSETRDSSREGQPCIQGVVAAQAQEGLEDLFHVQGQEGWR